MINAVHIFQREQVAIAYHFPTLRILKREFHTTELRTRSAIGTTCETILRGIAKAGIADTKCPMHKHFELNIRLLTMNLADFIQREFTSQYHTGEAYIMQPLYLFNRTIIGLCRGMCRHRQAAHHLKHSHVLYQNGINTSLRQRLKQPTRGIEFVIIDNGVYRDIDLCTKGMGIVAEFPDIIDTIAYSSTGTKTRCADIDGIGTMIDGRHTIFKILGWGK